MRRKRNSDDGWTVESFPDSGLSRFRVDLSRMDEIHPERRARLEEDARRRGMTLVELVSWAGNMGTLEFKRLGEQMVGGGDEHEAMLFWAWSDARLAVQEVEIWRPGMRPGDPGGWG